MIIGVRSKGKCLSLCVLLLPDATLLFCSRGQLIQIMPIIPGEALRSITDQTDPVRECHLTGRLPDSLGARDI